MELLQDEIERRDYAWDIFQSLVIILLLLAIGHFLRLTYHGQWHPGYDGTLTSQAAPSVPVPAGHRRLQATNRSGGHWVPWFPVKVFER